MFGIKIVEERKSKFNGKVRVIRSLGLGTYLQAGGITQSGGVVTAIWQKTLKKIKSRQQEVKNCLILGLGGGTVVGLVRKYWPLAKVTGVEIDPVMVELGEKYLGLKGVKVKIQDAFDFPVQGYDLVVVDLYCGEKFPEKFADEKFLHKLTQNKMVVFNRLYYGEKRKEAVKFGEKLEKIFKKVDCFYPEANLMFFCR